MFIKEDIYKSFQNKTKPSFVRYPLGHHGFSLLELMVVVALMAIITVIAIPSYNGFQARARQKEGFKLLTTYYTAAQSALAEYGVYPGNFVQTGFKPVGTLGYRLQAANGAPPPGGTLIDDPLCLGTQDVCNCAGICADFKIWQEAPLGVVGGQRGPQAVIAACPPLAVLSVNSVPGNFNFSVRVAGVVNLNASLVDVYGIDQTKNMVMCQNGLD